MQLCEKEGFHKLIKMCLFNRPSPSVSTSMKAEILAVCRSEVPQGQHMQCVEKKFRATADMSQVAVSMLNVKVQNSKKE